MKRRVAACLGLALLGASLSVVAQDSERLRNAKTLVFDQKYAEARAAWQQILAAGGPEAGTAAYWVARCSENMKEDTRALREYGEYLARKPADRTLAEEARTSRVGIAARLYRTGQTQYLPILREALADPAKTVRYYAAFQVAGLGGALAREAVPILKRIVAEEKDSDLVDRGKLLLLRVDPQALAPAASTPRASGAPAKEASWLKVRIYERGKGEPTVSVNVPIALAELALKALPDDARRELEQKGFEPDNLLARLRKLGPTEIVTVEGEDGEKVQIWIE
jgi:HEAT repeat protein